MSRILLILFLYETRAVYNGLSRALRYMGFWVEEGGWGANQIGHWDAKWWSLSVGFVTDT